MTIEWTPTNDRIQGYGDIYNRWIDSEQRIRQLEEENKFLNSALQSYTRVVVENDILKEKIKELEEELRWHLSLQK